MFPSLTVTVLDVPITRTWNESVEATPIGTSGMQAPNRCGAVNRMVLSSQN